MFVGGCVCKVPGCIYCWPAGYLLPANYPGAITLYVPGAAATALERRDVRARVFGNSNEDKG